MDLFQHRKLLYVAKRALNYRFDYSSNFIKAFLFIIDMGSMDVMTMFIATMNTAGYIKVSRGTYISRSLCQLFAAAGYKNLSTTFFSHFNFQASCMVFF